MMELQRLGRYVIERVLGRGAMGVVYLARDPVIGRQVALKTLTLPSDPAEAEEFHQRFLREARAAGILSHPGIVTVHDAGVDEGSGLSYIAMEYVEGMSIKQLQGGGHRFAFSDVARIGSSIAAALDYAHARGVVHRDIKPANILITPQGAVKITDFGVARLESSNLTTTGQFIGTPNYMSPEQITGGVLDGRSDLFSLGVVLFELLTGSRPFSGSSLTEVSYKIVHGPRPIPSQIRPGVPGVFNPIVLKLLEREPQRRYGRGADVARALDALRRFLAGLPGEPAGKPDAAPTQVARPATARSLRAELEASPTATSATTARPAVGPSVWRRRIATSWALVLIAAALVPVALVIALLAMEVDRGAPSGPLPGEPERRHRVAVAQRRAAEALAAGQPEVAERLLAQVWDQAPYSEKARGLLQVARRAQASIAERRANEERAAALIAEGKTLLASGELHQARDRFAQVQELVPGTQLAELAGQYAELSDAKVRSVSHDATVRPTAPPPAQPPRPAGSAPASIAVYFNSPLSAGTIEIESDGASLGKLPFDFSRKVFLGLRKKGTGVVEGDYQLPPGEHKLTARLLDDDGQLLGEETFSIDFASKGRYTLRIDMEGTTMPPRFSLRAR